MAGFVFHFVVDAFEELGVAPFVVHAGMDEILVAGGKFAGQELVHVVDNFFIALHCFTPIYERVLMMCHHGSNRAAVSMEANYTQIIEKILISDILMRTIILKSKLFCFNLSNKN